MWYITFYGIANNSKKIFPQKSISEILKLAKLSKITTLDTAIAYGSSEKKLGKEKGTKIIDKTNSWMEDTCTMIRENIHTPESKKIFTISFLVSLASWSFYGISFMIIAMGTGYVINAFDSIMAVMGANAIGNLPITIGGSGLAEFGIVAYINNLNPFDFDLPKGVIAWDAVIGWRIATYYVPIVITWLLLVKLALSKISKPKTA